jgi:hypothetical protein
MPMFTAVPPTVAPGAGAVKDAESAWAPFWVFTMRVAEVALPRESVTVSPSAWPPLT